MRHQYRFGSANVVPLRDVARIGAFIGDLNRRAKLLADDIAAAEERAKGHHRHARKAACQSSGTGRQGSRLVGLTVSVDEVEGMPRLFISASRSAACSLLSAGQVCYLLNEIGRWNSMAQLSGIP